MQKIVVENIICIDIQLPVELRVRSANFINLLGRSDSVFTALDGVKVLKHKNRFYALEKFAIVAAAKQIHSNLSLSCTVIELSKKAEIKERIINEIFVESLSSVHVTLLLELSRANSLSPRFKVHELAEITSCHRSALYNHQDKFDSRTTKPKQTSHKADLASSLDCIPSIKGG